MMQTNKIKINSERKVWSVTNKTRLFRLMLNKYISFKEVNVDRRPYLISIDGDVTSGKSFYSIQFKKFLSLKKIPSVIIHGDWFMTNRKHRKKELQKFLIGKNSFKNYDSIVCDFKKINLILQKINKYSFEENLKLELSELYNRKTGELDLIEGVNIKPGSIIIFEGTGLHNTNLSKYFDLKIRLEVNSKKETLSRLKKRELDKSKKFRLPASFIIKRFEYLDKGYDNFLKKRDGCNANWILDTTNIRKLKLLIKK